MTLARVAAGMAALLTSLAVQAGVVSVVTLPVPVSLPAVLVAAVALSDGAGTGMAYGFAAGLITDLGSTHPAGVLALCWMAVGLICGLAADRHSVRRDALLAAVICALGAAAATVVLAVLGRSGASFGDAVRYLVPTLIGDAVLALVLVPVVRVFLRSDALAAPRPPAVLLGVDS
ncbi:rod shape-determining protein MreD [Jatrophihabitans sp.]|uniref:rod shape-determining protein MreD n=1 Tax=Jatrophihabitans sp. TaxID=1932789 RepID=UPI0030C69322|nr:rod shape-determining protein MreD [Jatrophihabitans sp.]